MKRLNKAAIVAAAAGALLGGLAVGAPAAQAAPAPAVVHPMGSTCDTFPMICTYILNVGSYALRVDTNDRDGKQAWNAWLYPGENTNKRAWNYDVAGFELPAGSCAWSRSGGSGASKTYWGSKSKRVYVAMTDYDKWDVSTYYC